jgi:hypothetical protein
MQVEIEHPLTFIFYNLYEHPEKFLLMKVCNEFYLVKMNYKYSISY